MMKSAKLCESREHEYIDSPYKYEVLSTTAGGSRTLPAPERES
jgi:hypothetical protein